MGRMDEARKSLAWALEMDPEKLPMGAPEGTKQPVSKLSDIFKYPRSLAVSWITNLGAQTGYYGLTLWVPTLMVQLLGVTPARASFLLIFVNFAGLFGRVGLSYLSDSIGRKGAGAIASFGAAILTVLAAIYHSAFVGTFSVFWLILIVNNAFADGGFAIVGPYASEVWPVALRTTGMGSAYGFGGLGKVIGPLGLALIVGSSNIITPKASVDALFPAFSYLAAWFAIAGLAYIFIGRETKGKSLEKIEQDLESSRSL
jgi:MFS transporter, putative metabolite:H+ symporter